jgi:hypothetical protein
MARRLRCRSPPAGSPAARHPRSRPRADPRDALSPAQARAGHFTSTSTDSCRPAEVDRLVVIGVRGVSSFLHMPTGQTTGEAVGKSGVRGACWHRRRGTARLSRTADRQSVDVRAERRIAPVRPPNSGAADHRQHEAQPPDSGGPGRTPRSSSRNRPPSKAARRAVPTLASRPARRSAEPASPAAPPGSSSPPSAARAGRRSAPASAAPAAPAADSAGGVGRPPSDPSTAPS